VNLWFYWETIFAPQGTILAALLTRKPCQLVNLLPETLS